MLIVMMIGAIEFSENTESNKAKVTTTERLRKAIPKAAINLQAESALLMIVNESLLSTTKSPLPKIASDTTQAKIPNHYCIF